MRYRFKSDKETKIRDLKVQDENNVTAFDFCSLLSEATFKRRKPTCTFFPVNVDVNDIVEGVLVVGQSYAHKFKNIPEPGEIVEAAIPSWNQIPPQPNPPTQPPPLQTRERGRRRWQSPPADERRPRHYRRPRRWQSPPADERRPRHSRQRKRRRHKKRQWERM